MATTNKKTKGTKPKAPRPDVVLVKPSREDDLSGVTEFELFRCTIDGKPRVGLRVGAELLVWDKNGYPVRYPAARSDKYAFLDYMTDEEGVYIPGSAEGREVEEEHAVEVPYLPPLPADPTQIDQIPDGVTYIWARKDGPGIYRYYARNFHTKNGDRITLLIHVDHGAESWTNCQADRLWQATEIVEERDPERWAKHARREHHGVI